MNKVRTRSLSARQRGLSLIELMVAIAIGAIILVGLVGFASNTSRDQAEASKLARQIDNGRYALQMIQEGVRHAGFYGVFHGSTGAPAAAPSPCDLTVANLETAARLPLQVFDGTRPTALFDACLPATRYLAGTDIIVVRRADSEPVYDCSEFTGTHWGQYLPTECPTNDFATLDANDVYIQSNLEGLDIQKGDNAFTGLRANLPPLLPTFTTPPPATVRKWHVEIYFIDCDIDGALDCSTVASPQTAPSPTLVRLVLSGGAGGPQWVREPLAEGVEFMHANYGIDADDGAGGGPDGAPDGAYIANPSLADMANTMAVRLFLVLRNSDTSLGVTNSKLYQMGVQAGGGAETYPVVNAAGSAVNNGGAAVTIGDAFRRNLYTTTVHLVNPGVRRRDECDFTTATPC